MLFQHVGTAVVGFCVRGAKTQKDKPKAALAAGRPRWQTKQFLLLTEAVTCGSDGLYGLNIQTSNWRSSQPYGLRQTGPGSSSSNAHVKISHVSSLDR